jgi:hypothetical protein
MMTQLQSPAPVNPKPAPLPKKKPKKKPKPKEWVGGPQKRKDCCVSNPNYWDLAANPIITPNYSIIVGMRKLPHSAKVIQQKNGFTKAA